MSNFYTNELIDNFKNTQNGANLTIMESNADSYEKALQNESNTLDTMEAIADLYALIADLSEQVAQLKESFNGGNE